MMTGWSSTNLFIFVWIGNPKWPSPGDLFYHWTLWKKVINKHIFQVFLFAVRSSMGQIKSTGLVLSEKKNLVQIPIGNCKQKDLKNMFVDNLLPELKLRQSNILTMGDFNFDLQNKNFRFSEFMEHTEQLSTNSHRVP
jgi:hypothetical protein